MFSQTSVVPSARAAAVTRCFVRRSTVSMARVAPGSLAEDAGLRPRDVIVEINGQKVTSAETVEHTLGGLSSGQSVAFLVRRGQVTFYAGLRLP